MELNDNERKVLLQLLDAAVRQLGINAAEPVMYFKNKLALETPAETSKEEPKETAKPSVQKKEKKA